VDIGPRTAMRWTPLSASGRFIFSIASIGNALISARPWVPSLL